MSVKRLLFICMGNICRSPAAEGVMKHLVEQRGIADNYFIDSAGTIGYHIGEAADARMQRSALARGYSLTSQSRQIKAADLKTFDLILCADRSNFYDVQSLDRTGQYSDKIKLILDYGTDENFDEVPDPYYGGTQGFEQVLDLLEDSLTHLIDDLENETQA
jgi:low molecular weight protein-tyrosine phosphatase